MSATKHYALYYWSGIPGRGEFVRLALEEAGVPYADSAFAENGDEAVVAGINRQGAARPPFAPPYLVVGDMMIGQTANILLYLGERHGLAPKNDAARLWVNQLQLTIADLVSEVHDSHHPISSGLYYEDQKAEAAKRAASLREARLPKYLGYFDRILQQSKGDWLAGARRSYADLSLFHVLEGLRYGFPKTMRRLEAQYTALGPLRERVAKRPGIAAYLASDRRQPFNEEGIFRHYPELDR